MITLVRLLPSAELSDLVIVDKEPKEARTILIVGKAYCMP